MINPAKSYTADEYIEILRRRIWLVVVPFVLIVAGASVYAAITPREYRASTLVLVSPQRVPEAFVQATVTSKVEERLQSIAQEVMSRTRLEQVITEFRLYEKERTQLSREEVVELMRKKIQVGLPTKRDEKGHFTISYTGADPNTVTTVTNRLASLFIEENLKLRESQAVGTTAFLAAELVQAKARLDQMETAVTQYKRRYMGQLPEQRDTNLRLLEQLQNQYQRVGEALRAAQDRKLYVQKLLTDLELPITSPDAEKEVQPPLGKPSPLQKAGTPSPGRASASQREMAPLPGMAGVGGSYESQREFLLRSLDDLRTKYTENHPDVIATKKMLADLEAKKNTFGTRTDPRYQTLKHQMALIDMEIRRLGEEERNMSAQIGKYRTRIEQTPEREQDMASLMREHLSTKEAYERLLRKSQEAQQAENLEKRQQGEQFRIIDPARVPEKPFSPDVPKILLISLLAGLGCGLGLAFIREQMDRSFHDAGDAEIALGLKVLATIPRIDEKAA